MADVKISLITSGTGSTDTPGNVFLDSLLLKYGTGTAITNATRLGKLQHLQKYIDGNDQYIGVKLVSLEGGNWYIDTKGVVSRGGRLPDSGENTPLIPITPRSSSDDKKRFDTLYENFMTQKESVQHTSDGQYYDTSSQFYEQFVSIHDLLDHKTVIDLIHLYGTKYTGIINLTSYQSLKGMVNCGIQYTDNFGKVISKSVSFSIDSESFQMNLDKAILEYTGGCLRIFPDSSEITECIISQCYLTTYGNN